ncbi:Ribosomal L1 domain-containing protein [Drosera capensis]
MLTTSPESASSLKNQITRAITALQKWRHTKSQSSKPKLLPSDEFFYLTLTLKEIPPKSRTNALTIPLPHPLRSPDAESCLIIDDRKGRLTSREAKDRVAAEGVPVSKVVRLSKLRSDYKAFEAKRKLCDSYDMFVADKRVVPLLGKALGKVFYKKKKIPVPVELERKGKGAWKEEVERVLGSGLLYLGTGTCSVMKVGNVEMGVEEVVDNVVAAVDGAVKVVRKMWGDVRSVHLKLAESLALPGDEVMNKKSKKGSMKGRIREIQYMDNGVDDDLVGEESDHGLEMNAPVENEVSERKVDKKSNRSKKVDDNSENKAADDDEVVVSVKRKKNKDPEKRSKKVDDKSKNKDVDDNEIMDMKRKKCIDPEKRSEKVDDKFKNKDADDNEIVDVKRKKSKDLEKRSKKIDDKSQNKDTDDNEIVGVKRKKCTDPEKRSKKVKKEKIKA